ncbi:hyalin-like [Lytechinus pictus]|uniref:hyalin-like n=1 Tax=Lytechinus pictus TaxID=7653 RepID=UPI0030B9ED87
MTVPTENGTMYATVSWNAPNATDNSNNVTLTFNEEHTYRNSGLFPIGLIPLSYTAKDASGNRASCTFTVSVIDTENPVITGCPPSMTVPTEDGTMYATVSWNAPNATDNSNNVTLTFNEEHTYRNSGLFPIGLIPLSYTAKDASGNRASCTFTVSVIDTENPVITGCPPSMTVPTETGTMYATVSWNAPNATDNSNNVTLTFNEEHTYRNSGLFPIGLIPLSYTAKDASGNRASCTFTVSVIDTENPVITGCPPSMTVPTENGTMYATVSWNAPNATDNSNNVTLTFNEEHTYRNSGLFPIGLIPLSYTAKDASGNRASCTFTVSVIESCSDPCINGGTCEEGTCTCLEGFAGTACEEKSKLLF